MGETEDFIGDVLPRQVAAGTAVHNGDAGPWVSLWSRSDPVTLFGARLSRSGAAEVRTFNEELGDWFSDCSSYEIQLIAAGVSGDLGYTVAYEKTTASVHRHGDPVPEGDREVAQA